MYSGLSIYDQKSAETLQWLHQELGSIRTGRATPAVIEQLPVSCYGSITPLQQLASITSPEPQLLLIQPWDPSIVKDIEKAIQQSAIGIHPVVDGKVLRLPFPPMTEERRQALTKVVREKGEQAKIRIRGAREDVLKQLKLEQRDGSVSEDLAELTEKELQKRVEAANQQLETAVEKKNQELLTV